MTINRILITGSSGLVGGALISAFDGRGFDIVSLDLRARGEQRGDVRDYDRVQRAVRGCHGIIHLAAVSRVIWGERNPDLCWSTNVAGLRNVLAAASASNLRPWVIFASSREVYGRPEILPANEDCPLRPINVYARSKVEGERLVDAARRDGVCACVVRLSNVFGGPNDHPDRVVPSFARAAVEGRQLRVDGADHTFDFTNIEDVTRGILSLSQLLSGGGNAPPPIHLVSGIPTTLNELATMTVDIASSRSTIRFAPPRDFDVDRFVGDPARSRCLLGWTPRIPLKKGLERLIHAFRAEIDRNIGETNTT